jgi:hypothetical protein
MENVEQVSVVFRKFKQGGDIIALFPFYNEVDYTVMSYMRVGQHGQADYAHCVSNSVLATPEEYAPLLKELTGIGYSVKILKKARPIF